MVVEIYVKPRTLFKVPVYASVLRPDTFVGKSPRELTDVYVLEGSKKVLLTELFDIEYQGSVPSSVEEITLHLIGDFSKVREICRKMSGGNVIIDGNVGAFLGYGMTGGRIVVRGNVGDWLGTHMCGGFIEVYGDVGNYVGASLPGEKPGKGMRGGVIIIHGSAGAEIGRGMRGGVVVIEGSSDALPGVNMCGGTIVIEGDCDGYPGLNMRGGRIVILGRVDDIVPTFYIDSIAEKVRIKELGKEYRGTFLLLRGDATADISCNGRLFISLDRNSHLKYLTELLRW